MATPDYSSLPRLTISLGAGDTPDKHCTEYVDFLHGVYTRNMDAYVPGFSHYGTGTSIAVLPDTYEEWFEAVGYGTRRKVRRAEKLGYVFRPIERDDFLADIYEVNTSMEERQGREMGENYRKVVEPFGPLPDQPCPRHRMCTYGVLLEGKLVAYTWIYVTGEIVLLSTLLGHGDHLKNGVMYQLIAGVVEDQLREAKPKYVCYERHWSGLEGLRFFKEQMGFQPYMVTFLRGDERPPTTREKLAATWAPRLAGARRRSSGAVAATRKSFADAPASAKRLSRKARLKAARAKRRLLGQPILPPKR